jgi:hypothetical protein
MLDTALSVRDIQLAIINHSFLCDTRNDIIVPNVSWGLLPYEADLLVVRKSGTVLEFEIKRSFQDFKKDFEKHHTHDSELITYFYYVIPIKIEEKVKKFLLDKYGDDAKKYPAVLMYSEDSTINRMVYYDKEYGQEKRKNYVKMTEAQKSTLARLASIRYWNVVNELAPNGKSMKDLKIKRLNEDIQKLVKENDELYKIKGSDKWIRVTDELPEGGKEVLIRTYSGRVYLGWYNKYKNIWMDNQGDEITRYILCWADIPAFQN